jgi:superfamily II DNA helicase RecQ
MVIYMDSIADIEAAVIQVMSWLIDSGCTAATSILAIQVYYSELAELDKCAISTEFRKADSIWQYSSCHHIIIATDTMGMGIDNPDIGHIVQWR